MQAKNLALVLFSIFAFLMGFLFHEEYCLLEAIITVLVIGFLLPVIKL
jgi:hypothetical protein